MPFQIDMCNLMLSPKVVCTLGGVVHTPNKDIKPCLKVVAFGRVEMMKHFKTSSKKSNPFPEVSLLSSVGRVGENHGNKVPKILLSVTFKR